MKCGFDQHPFLSDLTRTEIPLTRWTGLAVAPCPTALYSALPRENSPCLTSHSVQLCIYNYIYNVQERYQKMKFIGMRAKEDISSVTHLPFAASDAVGKQREYLHWTRWVTNLKKILSPFLNSFFCLMLILLYSTLPE